MIPFVRDLSFEYGRPDQVSPLIRRVVANNPGPFTFRGTGTYIIGRGDVAVIDPGPDDADHLDALLAATAGERITDILVTHTHADHFSGAKQLAEIPDEERVTVAEMGRVKVSPLALLGEAKGP